MANLRFQKQFDVFPVLLMGVGYFVLAIISIYFSRGAGDVAHFWYPNAIGIAFLLFYGEQFRWRLLAVLAASNFLANWVAGSSWWLSATFVIPNVVEMVLATWLARHFQVVHDFDQSPQKMLRFILLICLFPSTAGALAGASLISFLEFSPFLPILLMWFVSSSVGMLSLLPLLLVFRRDRNLIGLRTTTRRRLLLYVAIVCLSTYFALCYLPFPFIYLVIPLILAAVETDTKTVAFLIFLESLVIGVIIHMGFLKQAMSSENGLIFLNYLPILVTFVPVLVLSASMNFFRSQDRQKREIELALQRKHNDIQMIIDNMPALIGFWDLDLKNRFANRMYLDYFGWKSEDILGRHVREIVGDSLYAQNLPFMEKALRGENQMFERTLIDTHGQKRETLTSYVTSYRHGDIDGVYAFVTDITEIKKARRAESAAQERLQSVIDSATEFSIIATDLEGVIRLFSKGAEKMLGYTGAEFLNTTSTALLHVLEEIDLRAKELSAEFNREITGFEVFVVKAKLGVTETREWTYVHKSGRKIPVRLVVTPVVDASENIIGYLGIANDISDEKQLQKLLIDAKDNAEKVSQAKSNFVANMSHEIRTPMNAVLGMSKLLASTNLNAEQRKYVEMISISGQSLLGILNDILDFSKIEANRLELSNVEFLLDDLLETLAGMMSVSVAERDIEVAIGVDASVPKNLMGDQLRLQQILTNLIGNAIKFTHQGEVSVFVDTDNRVDAETPNQVRLRFCVRDTGIGMDSQQLERLFSPFSQADASITRQFGGTGLGLSISKSILNLMGGEITVHSELGNGSAFTVVVPMITSAKRQTQSLHQPEQRLRLLVVDDNSTSKYFICETIRSWNWTVESASSGQQALEIVREKMDSQQFFDAILLDWQMPELDGFATIKQLREILPKQRTSCIIMANPFSRGSFLHDLASKYADAVLMKPMTGSSVFDTVHEAIGLRTGAINQQRTSTRTQLSDNQIQGAQLLLVEDNPFNQVVARGFLEQGGAIVHVVENGLLGVDHLRSHADQYHAVLMDVQMPVLDGISATRMIRQELGLTIPVIAMSAGVMFAERDRCTQVGMNDFVAKPIDVDQLFHVIAKYLPDRLNEISEVFGQKSNQEHDQNHDQKNHQKTEQKFNQQINAIPTSAFDLFNPTPFEKLLNAAPASAQKVLDSMRALVDQAPQHVANLQLALNENRHDDAARILHTMRGSLGTLGAKSFAALASEIESGIRRHALDEVPELLHDALLELDKTIAATQAWLGQQQAPDQVQVANVVSANLTAAQVENLRANLLQNNMAACDLFSEMYQSLKSAMPLTAFEKLEQAVKYLDFVTAEAILKEIVVA